MSIRDEEAIEKNREAQQQQRAARRSKEAEARPVAMHRAVLFLLRAAKENNPDLAEEANHYISTLDAELADANKVAEMDNSAPAEASAPADKKPNTAATLKRSKRFQRGT